MTLLEEMRVSPPDWANQEILDWEDVFEGGGMTDMTNFVVKEVQERNATIDMREVIGQRDHYAGQTWLEAATNPKYKPFKMERIFRLYAANPDYYFSGELNGEICLSSLNGGGWYSDSGGNHRTIVAKFACEQKYRESGSYPLVSAVFKTHYTADLEARDLFGMLLGLEGSGIQVAVERTRRSPYREGQDRTVIEYALVFPLSDFRSDSSSGQYQAMTLDEFKKYARDAISQDARSCAARD